MRLTSSFLLHGVCLSCAPSHLFFFFSSSPYSALPPERCGARDPFLRCHPPQSAGSGPVVCEFLCVCVRGRAGLLSSTSSPYVSRPRRSDQAPTMDWDLNRPAAVTRPPSIYAPEPPAKSFAMGNTSAAGKATPPPPMTNSSRRLSFGSFSSHHKPVKHGRGRYSDVELVPQPSDDPDDPLVC